jgi:hypothetical protein
MIADRMDLAIENYLACMDSDDKNSDRQTCVEQLFASLNSSIDASQMTSVQRSGFAEALNQLEESIHQSTNIQQDFLCLRTLYTTVVDKLKIKLVPVERKSKRNFATNKSVATNCYHQATATLKQCLQSIKTIQDPTQRETARAQCLAEYRALLQGCLCTAFPHHHSCTK